MHDRAVRELAGRSASTAAAGGRPLAGRDSRVESPGHVERAVTRPGGGSDVVVAEVADDLVRGPLSTPGRGSPVVGAESLQDRDEPLPLPAEHVEQVLRVEVAGALGLK
jgi:hypothetical protein